MVWHPSIAAKTARLSAGPHGIPYFLYVPHSARMDAPLFVSVHGITRNAVEHAIRLNAIADQYGAILIAPLFTSAAHHMYQQFGASIGGGRSDQSLFSVLDDVNGLIGRGNRSIHLFGFSGGAQFAHRFALAYPRAVERMIIASAGWYTLPGDTRRFPYGLRGRPHIADIRFDLDRFLRIPTKVVVGSRDTLRDDSLRQSARLDKSQGRNRIERGRRWVNLMNKEAATRNLPQVFEFETLAGANHSFTKCINECGLGETVGTFLFGAQGPQDQDGDDL